MKRHRYIKKQNAPSWWVRCAVLALACLQVIAPTWHICSMGATEAPASQKMAMAHCSMPEMSSDSSGSDQLNNQPMAMDYCLARLLQHVLANNQFHLVLDFNAVTISTLAEPAADHPLIRALPVKQARGPPLHLL